MNYLVVGIDRCQYLGEEHLEILGKGEEKEKEVEIATEQSIEWTALESVLGKTSVSRAMP